jgi:rhodanese-related sulfurtransferase
MKTWLPQLLRAAALLLLASVCSAALNLVRHSPLPLRGEWSTHVENRALRAGLQLVGIGALRKAVVTGAPRVLDARPVADFRAAHIPGAQSLPFDLAAEMLASMQIELTRDQPLIAYCARHDCDEGLELALFLRRTGYTNTLLFAGGLAEWRAAGGTVEVER